MARSPSGIMAVVEDAGGQLLGGRRGRSDRRSIANLNLLVVEKTQARWKSARALSIDRGTANQVQIVGRHALDHRLAGFHQPGQRAVGLPPLPACLKALRVWITARQTLQVQLQAAA